MPAQVTVRMTSDEAALFKGLQKVVGQQNKMDRGFKKLGTSAKRAGRQAKGAFGSNQLSSLKAYAAGVIGVGTAVAGVSRAYQVWLTNIREVASEARKASNEMIAFLALQEGGTKAKRAQRVFNLAEKFGITDRGQAFNIVQALQSARGGSFEQGLSGARTIFAAHQAGVSLEGALELERKGAALGLPPGQAVRFGFVTGQEESRDPDFASRVGSGLIRFKKDIPLGFAIFGKLAGVFAERADVFTRKAGKALSDQANPTFLKTIKRLGLDGTTQQERLIGLKRAGIDTDVKLAKAGLTEDRQNLALSTLLQGDLSALFKLKANIIEKAVPGLLVRKRLESESETPFLRDIRQMETLQAITSNLQLNGPLAEERRQEEIKQLITGTALRKLGREEGIFGIDLIDPEGRTAPFQRFISTLGDSFFKFLGNGTPSILGGGLNEPERALLAEENKLRSQITDTPFDKAVEKLDKVADKMGQAAAKMSESLRPPPLLVSPAIDEGVMGPMP